MSAEVIRKTVPLSQDELELIEAARQNGTAAHDVVTEIFGPDATRSEATTLHAALRLGLCAIRDRISERGYAALAAAQTDEDRAFHAANRARRRAGGGE